MSSNEDRTLPLWDRIEEKTAKRRILKSGKKEIVLENIVSGERFSCKTEYSVTLGRNPQCDLQLSSSDHYMSWEHLRLLVDDGRLYAEDMNSTNGSFLNKEKLTCRRQLLVGDILKLGHSKFQLIRFE